MIFKLLRRIPFFRSIGLKDLKKVYKLSRIHDYGPGEAIFTKSEIGNHMFIVLSGRVKIFSPSRGKKRKTFAYLDPGGFFGEMALLEGKTRTASAEAVKYTRLLVIGKADFKRLLVSDPSLTFYLLRKVCQRLRRADAEIEGLLFRNVLGRVSKTLHDLSKNGERFRSGVLLQEHYTQQELADLVGTSREPLTRALSSLRRAQILDVHHGRYFIKNPSKLETLCLSQP